MSGLGPIWRWLLLVSVSICAASGLVYELALVSLSTSLNGGGIVETSLIVAGYVAALDLVHCWSNRFSTGLHKPSSVWKPCWDSSVVAPRWCYISPLRPSASPCGFW